MNNQNPSQDFNQNNQGDMSSQNFGQSPQQDFNQGQNFGQSPQQDFNQGQNFGQAPQQDFNQNNQGDMSSQNFGQAPQQDFNQGPAQDFNQGQNFGQAPQQDFNQGPAQDFNQGQNFGQAPQQDFNPLANQGGGNNFDQQPANQGDNFSNPFAGFDTPAQPNPNMSQPMQQPQPTPDMNTGFDPNVFQDEEEEKPKKNKSLLLVLLLLIVIAVGFGAYIYFFVFNAPSKAPATTPTTSITTTTKSPKPFLNLNSAISSDMQISLHNSDLVKDHIQEKALENLEEAGTIKIIEPTIKNQYLNNLEVLTSLVDNVPENLLQSLGEQYILYTYYGEERPTLGLILSLKPNTTEIVSKIMTEWEDSETLIKSTSNLWLFSNKTTKEKVFKNTDVNGAVARCFGFTEKEAELCYLVSNDYFMITTSQASITKAHVALFGESTPAVNNTVEGVMEEAPVVEVPAE